MTKVYTGKGDDGTTGLLYGGRLPKDDARFDATGTVDEAQAFIGLARAAVRAGDETLVPSDVAWLDQILLDTERDLYVLMAEITTAPENQAKLTDGQTRVTEAMVDALGVATDHVAGRFPFPTEFVLPGQSESGARLDVARTVVRRAERAAIAVAPAPSQVVPYLNRLSSLLWTAARWVEADRTIISKEHQ